MSRRWRPLGERLIDRPPQPDEREFHPDIATLDTTALKVERARLRLGILLAERTERWAPVSWFVATI